MPILDPVAPEIIAKVIANATNQGHIEMACETKNCNFYQLLVFDFSHYERYSNIVLVMMYLFFFAHAFYFQNFCRYLLSIQIQGEKITIRKIPVINI
jgi:hypothetical protein